MIAITTNSSIKVKARMRKGGRETLAMDEDLSAGSGVGTINLRAPRSNRPMVNLASQQRFPSGSRICCDRRPVERLGTRASGSDEERPGAG